jgi:hypothetical protein
MPTRRAKTLMLGLSVKSNFSNAGSYGKTSLLSVRCVKD